MTDEINKEQLNTSETEQQALSTLQETNPSNKKFIIILIAAVLVIVILIVLAAIFLLDPAQSGRTEQIRDVFIIFMALESLIIGVALIVLIVQLSTLINLLQNEIKPIINATNETVNTLRGTAKFVSNNLVEPVIKINQLMAMVKRLVNPNKRK